MSSWFGSRSGSSGNVPAASSVHKQKHKQIEYLKEAIPNVVEVRRDELYRVDVTVNGVILTLDIKLPPSFPLTDNSPLVSVHPPVRHPWVNEQMLVDGSPLIKIFGIHSNLGKAIKQIIKEFTEHPPELMSAPQPTPMPMPSPSTFYVPGPEGSTSYAPFMYSSVPHTVTGDLGGSTRRSAPPPPPAAGPSRNRYQLPTVPDQLDDIAQMSTEDLNKYLNEEEGPVLVDQYVTKMDVIKRVHMDRDGLIAHNEDQAGINLRHEPEMQEAWGQLQEKFLEMQSLKIEYDQLLEEQKQLTERYQTQNVLTTLKTLTQQAETESEIIAEDFLDKKVPFADFIQKFKQQRVLHHERKSKQEKLSFTNSTRRDVPSYT